MYKYPCNDRKWKQKYRWKFGYFSGLRKDKKEKQHETSGFFGLSVLFSMYGFIEEYA